MVSQPSGKAKSKFRASWLVLLVPVVLAVSLIWYSRPGHVKPKNSLFDAAADGDLNSVKAHIETGSSVNDISSGHTALYTAAGNGDIATVRYLLDHGASPNAELRGRSTPLDAAALAGSLEVVTALIDKGAQLDAFSQDAETPLHAAASGGNVEIVKLLLDKGMSPAARRKNDHATPVCDAASAGHWDCIQTLLDHGGNIDTPGFHGRTPLDLAILTRHRDVSRKIIAAGADINIKDDDGDKPVTFALSVGDEELARSLIPKTRNLAEYQVAGQNLVYTAVYYAAPNDLIQELLAKGVSPNQISKGQSPLSIATENQDQALIDLLKKAGAK